MDEDYLLALKLQEEFQGEFDNDIGIVTPTYERKENSSQNVSHKKSSLVDPSWELVDPTPNIHALFIQFNDRFFWGKLHTVEVRWSPRMTSCAGVCVYQGRSGFCSVRLSLPLLQLRPRKDLIETLLHEMIHAYLFVTKNNRDRDGHGPEFHKHMYRINNDAGTNISVYHSFHDEVRVYQQHWWRCEGPCQKRPPFFGMVRRSMNRAPGPNDNWWAQHQATCGGRFQKIREPDGYGKKILPKKQSNQSGKGDIRSFFPGSHPSTSQGSAGKPFQPTNPRVSAPGSSKLGGGMSIPSGPTTGSGAPKSLPGYKVQSGSSGNQIPTYNKVVGLKDLDHSGSVTSLGKPSGSSVNNVIGFKDLNGQGTRKPVGRSHPGTFSGRGFTLGAGNSQSPGGQSPAGKGRGGFGGMLGRGFTSGAGSSQRPGGKSPAGRGRGGFGGTPGRGFTSGAGNSQRPGGQSPAGRGRGGFGGMLANRGGGTLVVTGKPRFQERDSKDAVPSPQPAVSVFSGEGKVLGRDQNQSKVAPLPYDRSKPNPFQKNIPVFSNGDRGTPKQSITSEDSYKRSSPEETQSTQKKAKPSGIDPVMIYDSDDDSNIANEVPCPICSKKVKEADINSHLDDCVMKAPTLVNPVDCIIVSDDDSEKDDKMVDCPVCNKKILESAINSHLNSCITDGFSDDDTFEANQGKKSDVKCPICGEEMKASELDSHIENCAHCSVQDLSGVFDDDFDEEEDAAVGSPSKRIGESGERLYPCPCCMALQEESKMNNHLDVCMAS